MRLATLVLSFLVLAAGSPAAAESQPDVDPRLRRWLGARAVDLIQRAKRAEIVRVDPHGPLQQDVAAMEENVAGYRMIGRWRPVSASILSSLSGALLSERTYTFPSPSLGGLGKGCGGFQPAVAVRFWPEGRGEAPPVDVLLCFTCADVAAVDPTRRKPLDIVDMGPGYSTLLRLASAALPDFPQLGEMLRQSQVEQAQRLLFQSMLPADVQLATEVPWNVSSENGSHPAVNLLLAHVSGKDLFVLASRALGVKGNDWRSDDGATIAIYSAARTLEAIDIIVGLREIQRDQVALAGAGELLLAARLSEKLSNATQAAWLPTVAEAVLIRQPHDQVCLMLKNLGVLIKKESVPLLLRVRRGLIPMAPRVSRAPVVDAPSAAACAMITLLDVDAATAASELRGWHPATPIDLTASRAVRARLGDPTALDASVFGAETIAIPRLAVAAIRAHPTASAMELLVARAIDHRWVIVRADAEAAFLALTGAVIPPDLAGDDARRVFIRLWWDEHRASWKRPGAGP